MSKADVIRQELSDIQGRAKKLKAESVVEWARKHPKSELHSRFTWDNNEAADKYRLWQARELIKLVVEVQPNQPLYVSLSIDRTSKDGGYRLTDDALNSKGLREVLVRDVLSEFSKLRTRWTHLHELQPIFAAIDALSDDAVEHGVDYFPATNKPNGQEVLQA
jgi:hypothetical protein